MSNSSPEIIEVNPQQLEALLERAAANTLSEQDTELLRQIFASYAQLFQIVGDKNTTIARLRKLLFGDSSEKAKDILDDPTDSEPQGLPSQDLPSQDLPSQDLPSQDSEPQDSPPAEDSGVDIDPDDDIAPDEDSGGEHDDSNDHAASDEDASPPAPGHGRYGADDYPGAE